MLDTVVETETPEGILLELRPAGLGVRFYAFALDWAIRLGLLYVAAATTMFMRGFGAGFWLVLLFALEWLYPIAFELSHLGATPGKRAFGLRVVMDSGLPVTPAAAVTRNLLRAADFLPFTFGFAIVSMLLRPDGKRLGDLAASTLVVHETRTISRPPALDVPPVVPMKPLTTDGQTAIIALASRAPRLTAERLDELAALAAVVSGDRGRSGREVTRRVLGVAQWSLGRR